LLNFYLVNKNFKG